MKFDFSHVAEFAYGLIISDIFVNFGNVISTEFVSPVLNSGVDKAIGKNKKLKLCNTEIQANKLLVHFIQVLLVLVIMYILSRANIKPTRKLF